MPSFTIPGVARKYGNTWPSGGTGSLSTFCRPTPRRPIRLNGSGGTCTKKSLAITAAGISRSYSIWSSVGWRLDLISTSRLPSIMPRGQHRHYRFRLELFSGEFLIAADRPAEDSCRLGGPVGGPEQIDQVGVALVQSIAATIACVSGEKVCR